MSNLLCDSVVPRHVREFAESNVKKALAIGAMKLNIFIPFQGVKFFNKSKTAGYVFSGDNSIVYLNLELLKKNSEYFANDTIPHEVAHLFAYRLNKREAHHGKTWKKIMQNVFGLEPKRCHDLDTTGVGRDTQSFKYICACKKHIVGKIRHNKMEKGAKYRCASCYKTLTFLSKCD